MMINTTGEDIQFDNEYGVILFNWSKSCNTAYIDMLFESLLILHIAY